MILDQSQPSRRTVNLQMWDSAGKNRHLENMFLAFDVEDPKREMALLLHYAGPEVMDLLEILPESTTPVSADTPPDECQQH